MDRHIYKHVIIIIGLKSKKQKQRTPEMILKAKVIILTVRKILYIWHKTRKRKDCQKKIPAAK